MRKGLVWAAALLAIMEWGLASRGAEPKAETLVRWHFAGTKQLAAAKELEAIHQILALPETAAFRDEAAATVAQKAGSHFTKPGSTNIDPAAVNLIKPLVPDLFQNESRLELSARGAADANWILALNLPADRLNLWSKNLTDLAKLAGMKVESGSGAGAWSAMREEYHFAFSREKTWLVLEGGFSNRVADAKLFKDFRNSLEKKAGKAVLTAEINFPLVGKIWSAPRFEHAPKIDLTVTPRKSGLRSEAQLVYPASLNITPEKWNVPTDLVRDPLLSFTAIQGLAGPLSRLEAFKKMGAQKTPNQLFIWSEDFGPFAEFLAADVGNPAEVVETIAKNLMPGVTNRFGGGMMMPTNRVAVLWRGLPIVVPFIEQAPAPDSSFLRAGLFPINSTNQPPRELFQQLNQKNLVYYDWEITQAHLQQWRPIWQLTQILQSKLLPSGPSEKWLLAIAPKLGNTVTEGSLKGANRIDVVRQSQSGFTALELVLLAHWLGANETAEVRNEPHVPAARRGLPPKAAPRPFPRTAPKPAPAGHPAQGAPRP